MTRAELHLPKSTQVYELALEGLVRVNEWILKHHSPHLPSVLDPKAGVRYKREPREVWRNVAEVIAERWGDCEDLAAARVAELRAQGEKKAYVRARRVDPRTVHIEVVRSDGKIEDPSKWLGMSRDSETVGDEMPSMRSEDTVSGFNFRAFRCASNFRRKPPARPTIQVGKPSYVPPTFNNAPRATPSGAASPSEDDMSRDQDDYGNDYYGPDGEADDPVQDDPGELMEGDYEEIGADVSKSPELTWTVDRTPTGWRGTVRIPLDMGRAMLVSRVSDVAGPKGKDDATKKALSAATGILDSDIAKALIPPQAQMALNILRSPQAAAVAGKAFDVTKKLKFW